MNGDRRAIAFARLDAGRGAGWLKEAYAMLSLARMPWLLLLLCYYVILVVIDRLPIIGQLAVPILKPVFAVGFLAAAWSQERGKTPQLKQLFQGFRSNLWALVPLGVVLLIGIMAAVLSTSLIDGGRLLDALAGRIKLDEALLADDRVEVAMVFGVLCALPVMMALWFAPALVVFQDCTALQALGASLRAALANWKPIGVYGLLVFFFGGVLPGIIIALIAMVAPQSFASAIVVAVLLPYMALLSATMHISDYVSYREVFHRDETRASMAPVKG